MWLIICGSNDLSGLWTYQGLKKRGLESIELVSSEMLAYSLGWEHRVGRDGNTIKINLADGRTLDNGKIGGVLNRMTCLPCEYLNTVNSGDRDYAIQELTAFWMSWLNTLPNPLFNRPTPQGLSGQWRHISEWVKLAAIAGLNPPDYKQSSHEFIDETSAERRLFPPNTPVKTIIVVGGYAVGDQAPAEVIRGCQRLAKLADIGLLGIEFTHTSTNPWTFAGATPMPNLTLGGEAFLDAIALALQGKSEEI